jgi:hypothetical protein
VRYQPYPGVGDGSAVLVAVGCGVTVGGAVVGVGVGATSLRQV